MGISRITKLALLMGLTLLSACDRAAESLPNSPRELTNTVTVSGPLSGKIIAVSTAGSYFNLKIKLDEATARDITAIGYTSGSTLPTAVLPGVVALDVGANVVVTPRDGYSSLLQTLGILLFPVEIRVNGAVSHWVISLDSQTAAEPIPKTLLGQYDLMGGHFDYRSNAALKSSMGPYGPSARLPGNVLTGVGFSEWRVSVGLSLPGAHLLPSLTNGDSCLLQFWPAYTHAPFGWGDDELIASRDWFVHQGSSVTVPMTNDDTKYSLGYVRKVVDTATAFGAKPFLNIDFMPRALSMNKIPNRGVRPGVSDPCHWPLTNAVSNAPPENAEVFASAATGMVKRLLEGSGLERGRPLEYIELWNEPDLPYFWDRQFEQRGIDRFFEMGVHTMAKLDAYRRASSHPGAKGLKYGLGGFAQAEIAANTITSFDKMPIGSSVVPMDFVSYHSYWNDPALLIKDMRRVAAAKSSSANYRNVELVLSEWGPSLTDTSLRRQTNMDYPLLVSTALSVAASDRLISHAHHAIFWAYYPMLSQDWGLLDHEVRPKPLYWAYALLSRVVDGTLGMGARRLPPIGRSSGEIENGYGAVVASRDVLGTTRVLLTNRNTEARTVRIDLDGSSRLPRLVLVMDDAHLVPRPVPPSTLITLPPRSIVLVEK